jgi:hypothetical protein
MGQVNYQAYTKKLIDLKTHIFPSIIEALVSFHAHQKCYQEY